MENFRQRLSYDDILKKREAEEKERALKEFYQNRLNAYYPRKINVSTQNNLDALEKNTVEAADNTENYVNQSEKNESNATKTEADKNINVVDGGLDVSKKNGMLPIDGLEKIYSRYLV